MACSPRYSLEGRIACVTGGGKGIGRAVAERFAKEGAHVCIMDRDSLVIEEAVTAIQSQGGAASGHHLDVKDQKKVEEVFQTVEERYGGVSILVNNAGITKDQLLFRMSQEEWASVIGVHLNGAFHCTQAAQKQMVKIGYGRIVTISSVSALGNKGQVNYATAKAGLQGFVKSVALELGPFGITSNAVAPGFIESDMTKATARRLGKPFADFVEEKTKVIPVGRSGKPEDVAGAALFFAGEESSFISGQVLYVAGGPKA